MILLILGSTAIGVLVGWMRIGSGVIAAQGLTWSLIALIFAVGWEMGSELETVKRLIRRGPKLLAVPLVSIIGSIGFGAIAGSFLKLSSIQSAIVASGMGWYSFAGSFLSAHGWSELGTIAFATNVLRELLTIVLAPVLAHVDPIAPVASGGATSMDSTLGVVRVFSGKEIVPVSFLNGFVITLLVPVVLTLLLPFLR